MKRVLVTGMSGTGKSTVVRELVARGYRAIDTDDGWCEPAPGDRQRWREDAMAQLLQAQEGDLLFVAGCEENQVAFYDQFDHIVLLTTPVEITLQRLAGRTTNDFGKAPGEVARILDDLAAVEPLLREVADHEISTTIPADLVATEILRLVGD
jgi:dephospho-CoA kinase